MANCSYCNKPVDRNDSILKTPNGERVHYFCGDKMIEEWPELREIARMLNNGNLTGAHAAVKEFYRKHCQPESQYTPSDNDLVEV